MKAGVLEEILLSRRGNCGNITDMLHHGCNRDGSHDEDRSEIEFSKNEGGQTDKTGIGNGLKIEDRAAVDIGHAERIHDDSGNVGDHDAQKDGDDLEHAFAPDVKDDDNCKCDQSKRPAGGGIGDRGGSQSQADADNDGACDDGRQELHDLFDADCTDDQGQHQIQKACDDNTAASIGKLFAVRHISENTAVKLCYSSKSSEKSKGGSEESRYSPLCEEVEKECSDAGKEKSYLNGKPFSVKIAVDKDRDQDRGAEHGEQVLNTEDRHFRITEFCGIINWLI